MKNALLILLVIISSCQSVLKDPTDKFIPGTYVRFSEHEFGREHDTLVISLQNPSARQYRIERRWKYERMLDGTSFEPEYKQTTTSAVYDEKEHVLNDETRLEYSFEIKRNALFAGTTEYRKIN
jgi:hypothetical protein